MQGLAPTPLPLLVHSRLSIPQDLKRSTVASPVIDANPVLFFGTGDGSAGYYAERPLDERQQIGSARTYESAL